MARGTDAIARDFFRPGFWDLLGTVLGLLGLGVGGSLAITISPSTGWAAAFIVATILVAIGGFSLRTYLFTKDFPFGRVEQTVRLVFRKVPVGQQTGVRAVVERDLSFAPRAPNLNIFDRYQLIPDSMPQSAATALAAMKHSFRIEAQRGSIFKRRWHKINSVKAVPHFSDMRPLRVNYEFQSNLKGFAKRIRLIETLELPNDFSQALEFYEVEITEPARRRDFEFVFEDMDIEAARVISRHGAKSDPSREIDVVRVLGAKPQSSFCYKVRNASVGTRIRFEWDWAGL